MCPNFTPVDWRLAMGSSCGNQRWHVESSSTRQGFHPVSNARSFGGSSGQDAGGDEATNKLDYYFVVEAKQLVRKV